MTNPCPITLFATSVEVLCRVAERGDLKTVRAMLVKYHGLPPTEAKALTDGLRGQTPEQARKALEARLGNHGASRKPERES